MHRRDKEEREREAREMEEKEALKNMTEAERRAWEAAHPKVRFGPSARVPAPFSPTAHDCVPRLYYVVFSFTEATAGVGSPL